MSLPDTLTLKHGTCACRAERITQVGFRRHTYFTDSLDVAEYYGDVAMDECDNDCQDWTVLVARVPTGDSSPDYPSFEEPLRCLLDEHGVSNDSDWHAALEAGTLPYPTDITDIATSLEMVRAVRCNIPLSNTVLILD